MNPIELIWAQVKGFVAENNTTFRLKDVKELVYGGFGRITKEVWAKAEDHVLKIEKEYGKENCIDRSEIPPIIIDFDSYPIIVYSMSNFSEFISRKDRSFSNYFRKIEIAWSN